MKCSVIRFLIQRRAYHRERLLWRQHYDIANGLGATRKAGCDYFPSKNASLEGLAKKVTVNASKRTKSISSGDERPPIEVLRKLILRHAQLIPPIRFGATS